MHDKKWSLLIYRDKNTYCATGARFLTPWFWARVILCNGKKKKRCSADTFLRTEVFLSREQFYLFESSSRGYVFRTHIPMSRTLPYHWAIVGVPMRYRLAIALPPSVVTVVGPDDFRWNVRGPSVPEPTVAVYLHAKIREVSDNRVPAMRGHIYVPCTRNNPRSIWSCRPRSWGTAPVRWGMSVCHRDPVASARSNRWGSDLS